MSDLEQKTTSVEERTAYRGIFKATSLFGGVQLWKILIEIVKQKFIAILLGPTGMGISGLYTSATQLIQGLTSMGLSSSAVKNVAEANGSGDFQRISRVVTVLRKLVWVTGLLGMIVVIALSPILSKSTFGNYDYTIPFILLSVTLLFQQLSAGQSVVLQGMRKLKHLAKSGVLGSFFGLVISVPIYYFFGIEGIVPTLILSSITTLLLTWYFSRKIKIEKQNITPKQTFQEGKEMLKMGLVMSLNSILVLGVAYIVRIFIVRIGGTDEVGLYTAGFAIVNGYVGLIFTAMGTDYYPRLAGVNKDNQKCKEMINQQAEIAILIIAPIIMIFLLIAPYAITLLYSNQFTPITGFMQWAMLGMIFKAISWSMGYLIIAKGESKLFTKTTLFFNSVFLINDILFYYIFGLTGLGIAFAINYFIHLFGLYIITNKKYKFTFDKKIFFYIPLFVFAVLLELIIQNFTHGIIKNISGAFLVIIIIVISLYQINIKLDLHKYIKNKYGKNSEKNS